MNRFILAAFLSVSVGAISAGCGDTDNNTPKKISSTAPDDNNYSTKRSAIKIDPTTGGLQTATGPDDPTCSAEGLGQLLRWQGDGYCHYFESDDDCTYAGLEGGPKACTYTQCANDGECTGANNPDPEHLTGWCLFTQASIQSDIPGLCFWAFDTCKVLEDTPCEASGVLYCANNACTCTAQADMGAASPETCDAVDNDCDGDTDEDFSDLGMACDGTDTDMCAKGTYTCAASGLDVECTGDAPNMVETCNGVDDDCDGQTDEDFTELGKACDDSDDDLCALGTVVCKADGTGVWCKDDAPNMVETCNGQDDDCDGQTDEGVLTKFYADMDSDMCGKATGGSFDDVKFACSAPSGYITGDQMTCDTAVGDCDDTKSSVYGGAAEVCDELDNDCDGQTDEGVQKTFHWDFDGDGYGDGTSKITMACTAPDQMVEDTSDCDDSESSVHPGATEVCNGWDDNCNGDPDEGCDDDGDGYCDVGMAFSATPSCMSGDCNDGDPAVNPGMEEQCITPGDDNCDGDTEHLKDGKTLACSSCANALTIPEGVEVQISMGSEPNVSNDIDSYACWNGSFAQTLKTTFSAPEVVLKPDVPNGSKCSLVIVTKNTGTVAFRLHNSCYPVSGTSKVTAFEEGSAVNNGTCAAFGNGSVPDVIVGTDWVALDAATAKTVTVKFTCVTP